jgi:hypothetical protein
MLDCNKNLKGILRGSVDDVKGSNLPSLEIIKIKCFKCFVINTVVHVCELCIYVKISVVLESLDPRFLIYCIRSSIT